MSKIEANAFPFCSLIFEIILHTARVPVLGFVWMIILCRLRDKVDERDPEAPDTT